MTNIKPGEVARRFSVLGLSSFGGPTAHLGYFREEFVNRRRWLDDSAYADIVAVSQFLPGAGSSQVGMGLGYHRGGWAGLALAWLSFTFPSALILAVLGFWFSDGLIDPDAGWIRGLLATAVAVVFHAVAGMAKNLAAGPLRATVAVASALAVLLLPSAFTHLLIIVAAGVLGVLLLRDAPSPASESPAIRPVSARAAILSLVLFFLLLVGFWLGAQLLGGWFLTRSNAFFSTGALVFGGGHVVMPLLQGHAVDGGWMSQETFLVGYSAAQAVPGPLFTFATYVGAVDAGIWGAVWATLMIFLPSALLLIAALHFWGRWRSSPWLRAAFTGINAAVVGLLLAAFWDPVLTHGVTDTYTLGIAAVCWLMLAQWKLPPWSVAAFGALSGALIA